MTPREPLTKKGKPRRRAPGAGRPSLDPKGETVERRTVWLYPRQWADAEREGGGNVSAGLRAMLAKTARKGKAKP